MRFRKKPVEMRWLADLLARRRDDVWESRALDAARTKGVVAIEDHTEDCESCVELQRRLQAIRDELRHSYAENSRLRMQREEVAEHLRHAVDERDALQVQVDRMVVELTAASGPPLPRFGAHVCRRCGNSRKVDAGEDHLGEVIIPCPDCCCLCGDYTGGGPCEADRETP